MLRCYLIAYSRPDVRVHPTKHRILELLLDRQILFCNECLVSVVNAIIIRVIGNAWQISVCK